MTGKVYEMFLSEDKVPYLEKKIDLKSKWQVTSPNEAIDILNYIFRAKELPEEHVWMIALNIKGEVLGVFEISHGTSSTTVLTPREIYMRALMVGANSIIVAHNHPSGDPTPSQADCDSAQRFREAGKILGITMSDFIIIADFFYHSFRENNTIDFS